jgi:hypothetical protein
MRRELEDRFKGFKSCEDDFSLFTALFSFEVKKTDVNVQMELNNFNVTALKESTVKLKFLNVLLTCPLI